VPPSWPEIWITSALALPQRGGHGADNDRRRPASPTPWRRGEPGEESWISWAQILNGIDVVGVRGLEEIKANPRLAVLRSAAM